MIEPPFRFLDVSVESSGFDSAFLCQSRFGDTPKTFNPVHMCLAVGEHVVAVLDPVMAFVTVVHQPVVSLVFVGINGGVFFDKPCDYGHESGAATVVNHLGVNPVPALFHAENDCFAARPATAFALDPAGAEIRLVYLDFPVEEGRLASVHPGNPPPDKNENPVDCVAVQAGQGRTLFPVQVCGEAFQQLPEFRFANVRVSHVFVSHR